MGTGLCPGLLLPPHSLAALQKQVKPGLGGGTWPAAPGSTGPPWLGTGLCSLCTAGQQGCTQPGAPCCHTAQQRCLPCPAPSPQLHHALLPHQQAISLSQKSTKAAATEGKVIPSPSETTPTLPLLLSCSFLLAGPETVRKTQNHICTENSAKGNSSNSLWDFKHCNNSHLQQRKKNASSQKQDEVLGKKMRVCHHRHSGPNRIHRECKA